MESGTEPSTTTKTKNPKKVEAGRKGAEARKRKREELEKQARAGQARAHAEVSHGDMAAPSDEPHEKPKPTSEEPLFGGLLTKTSDKTLWIIGGCVGLGAVLYLWRRKNSGTSRPATRHIPPAQQPPAQQPPAQPATTSGRKITPIPVIDRFAE